jgi:hypothetical protein
MADDFDAFFKKAKETPSDDFSSFYSGAKAKAAPKPAAAPVKEEPVYDPMGAPTGYTQPALPKTKTPDVGDPSFYAREFSKGVAGGAVGLPGEIINIPSTVESLGRLGLRAAGADVSAEPAIPRVPYGAPEMTEAMFGKPKSKAESAFRVAGELSTPFVPSLLKAPSTLSRGSKLERALEEAQFVGGRMIESGKAATAEEIAQANKERLIRETVIGRQAAKIEIPAEQQQINKAARSEISLAEPQVGADIAAGKDVDSQLRQIANQKYGTAEKLQQTEGGGAFEKYKEVANTLQNEKPFGLSLPGQQLKDQLNTVIRGGSGDLRSFGEDTIKIAKDIKRELYGRDPSEVTAAEIVEAAKSMPPSFSEGAKRTMALEQIIKKESTGRRPVDWEVVDNKLRELRQRESAKGTEGYVGVERERFGSAADRIETALKSWVGEQNYPREAYRVASEPLNKFRTKLGKALTERESIPYSAKEGEFLTSEGRIGAVVFEDKDSVKFAKQLLGDAEVNALGEQHAINQLANKNAKQAVEWLNSNNSRFVDEVPNLRAKLDKYAANIARREGDAEAMTALKSRYEKDIQAVKGTEATIRTAAERTQKTLDKLSDVLDKPTKLDAKFLESFADDMRQTKLFSEEELANLVNKVETVSQIQNQQQRRSDMLATVGNITKKLLTLGQR